MFIDLTVIIIIYYYEYDEFEGFAKLLYPIIDEFNENKKLYKIEWLWKNKMDYSEVGHLMNRADHDHFLNEGKNGCPIHKDLGNYICRLMIKRLSREELIELINEKNIFKNQILYNQYLQNLKRYQYDYNDYYYNYYNNYNYFDYEYDDDDNSYNENISHKGKDKAKLKDSNDKVIVDIIIMKKVEAGVEIATDIHIEVKREALERVIIIQIKIIKIIEKEENLVIL